MSTELNFEHLLDKYMFHVSRCNGGNVFMGVGWQMKGFDQAEIRALQRASSSVRNDYDLLTEMTGDAENEDDR